MLLKVLCCSIGVCVVVVVVICCLLAFLKLSTYVVLIIYFKLG